MLLAIALIAYVMTKAISDARIDHTYARQGLVSPRLEAKYGAGAREKTARYGFFDFLGDAWSDHWQRRAAALTADREAYLANPGQRVRFRDRLATAQRVMAMVGRTLVEPVPTRAEREPVEVAELQPDPAPVLAVDTGDVPVGAIRHTDTGREQWTGAEWEPFADKAGHLYEGDGDGCPASQDDHPNTAMSTSTEEATPVSDFEATNFETAVPALDALTAAAQNLSDHVAGAEAAAAQFNDQVNEIDQDRRAVEEAATAVMEQLAARNLDADTMGQVTAAMEQIRAGDLSKAMDYIDAAMTSLSGAKAAAQEASGAASAASATVVSKYGDAASTVASELSGDASFLHSGGTGGDGAAPAGGAGASGESSSGGSTGDQGGSKTGGQVYTEPIHAPGQHFGTGNVYNVGPGGTPPVQTATGGGRGGRSGHTVTFNGPVSAEGSHAGSGPVTNNWGSDS